VTVRTAQNYKVTCDCNDTTRDQHQSAIIDRLFQHYVMDDWKLKTSPVVKLKRPNKTLVHFSFICCFWGGVLIMAVMVIVVVLGESREK